MPVSPWLAVYLLAGPVFAVVVVTATLFGRHRLDRLILRSRAWRREGQPVFPDDTPSVTVVIPVKDEAGAIESCVRSLLEQDYPKLDVLVINDRSTDGTDKILDRLAEEVGGRLRVRHLTELPDGWLGKPHALHTGVTLAGDTLGDWLVFVDSDVECSRDAVSHCMAIAQQRNYQMVSLLTGLIAPTMIERLVTPTAAATWMVVF
ncbi:MAG: glycosyltransferase family 2 protein, partial [Planctomycetota bacterium]